MGQEPRPHPQPQPCSAGGATGALERVYGECPKPSSLRRQQLIRECTILANIEPKQIKV
ncbi:Homeobox-leucine zipper protein HOX32 [Platanthera zijinensis]|uniref:Homeobox-leucine zipper protein HOX32 n=1 Tax=Platanthera zijinensis TaxID=2320716 RepID=A0AAP0GA25_9ASPA